jgi:hypothetical protein
MGELNLDAREKQAIRAIDDEELAKLVAKAIEQQQMGDLHRLPLSSCGPYVSNELRYFQKYLAAYSAAKSPAKRASTHRDVQKAGDDLVYAFRGMQHRLEEEERDALLFSVDDHIWEPRHFTRDLDVTIHYQWRPAINADWVRGSITFTHHHDPKPVYMAPYLQHTPKRKPSKAKQEWALQEELFRAWEHFRNIALYTMRDYLRDNRETINVPETFKAKPDTHSGRINNHSCNFWS